MIIYRPSTGVFYVKGLVNAYILKTYVGANFLYGQPFQGLLCGGFYQYSAGAVPSQYADYHFQHKPNGAPLVGNLFNQGNQAIVWTIASPSTWYVKQPDIPTATGGTNYGSATVVAGCADQSFTCGWAGQTVMIAGEGNYLCDLNNAIIYLFLV